MKAAIRYKYCEPDKLIVSDISIPKPKDDEILVKLKSTTVNRSDCGVLTGRPLAIRLFAGLFNPKIPVTGTDFSGVVVDKGKMVKEFNLGDNVYGFFDQGLGSHAEYFTVSIKKSILKKPEHLSFEQAVASIEGAHYAFYFLNKLTLQPGVKVLVNGGTGAIGNAAIQFLKYYGVEVVATCETDFVDMLISQGANRVIDYTKEDFTKLNEQFDYVFDAVGKSSFGKCKRLLKTNGIYISSELGPYWQNLWMGLLFPLLRGRRIKFPIPLSIHRSMEFIHQLIIEGKFKPLIDRRYSINEIREAFKYVMTGQKKGNVIIVFD